MVFRDLMFRIILIPEKKGEIKMFEMNVPYDKGQMKIKLEDKNLAGVLEGRQSDYKTTLSENEIVEQSLNHPIGEYNGWASPSNTEK